MATPPLCAIFRTATAPVDSGSSSGVPGSMPRLGVQLNKLFKPGTTLSVGFLPGAEHEGTTDMQKTVRDIANIWTKFANIHFAWLDDLLDPPKTSADIRISFKPGINGSALGTDIWPLDTYDNPHKPTMQLASVRGQDANEARRAILHEFGHAIGCLHEHQNPDINEFWNVPVALAYFQETLNWSEQDIRAQILNPNNFRDANYTPIDPRSIMIYPIPRRLGLTRNDMLVAESTYELSTLDKDRIKQLYPRFQDSYFLITKRFEDRPTPQIPFLEQRIFRFPRLCVFDTQLDPSVRFAVGLNYLDIDRSRNTRINTYVRQQDTGSYEVTLKSWDDTRVYDVGCVWVDTNTPQDSNFIVGRLDVNKPDRWTTEDENGRAVIRRVSFPLLGNPFRNPPKVVVWLSRLDFEAKANIRIDVSVTATTREDFTLRVRTWADSIMHGVSVNWIAYDPTSLTNNVMIDSGSFEHPGSREIGEVANNTIEFAQPFRYPPKAFAALCMLDTDHLTNVRVKVPPPQCSATRMQWTLETWSDTTLYRARANYIAIERDSIPLPSIQGNYTLSP